MMGHTKRRTTETRMETSAVMMATQRLPEKKASQSGRRVLLNLLYMLPPMMADRMPMKQLPAILEKAMPSAVRSQAAWASASMPRTVATTAGLRSCWIIRKATRPARPAVPS